MAQPDWTGSPIEWALLRDQLTTSSHPSLSNSIQVSSYILISLLSLSIISHSCSIYLRFKKKIISFTRPSLIDIRLGYHHPNLSFFLPFIFLINAILNLVSISSLLSDASRLKFKGHTLAIQHINYSLLLSAGVLTTWALACGLPPFYIGIWGPLRNGARRSIDTSIHPGKTIRPSRFNLIGYSSLVLVLLIPLPCTILTKKATDDINHLTDTLIIKVNQILQEVDQPAHELVNQTLKIINKLDQTSNFLFLHLRMISALHLFFILFILSVSAIVSVHIVRSILGKIDDNKSQKLDAIHRLSKGHQDELDHEPIDDQITEPKPAQVNNSTRHLAYTSSIGGKLETDQYGPQDLCNKSDDQINPNQTNRNSFSSLTSDIHCLSTDDHANDNLQSIKTKKYIKKIKWSFGSLAITCLCFIVLNFCIVCNLLKYPDEISIGDLCILKLEWSTWLWNGTLSPLIGLINCVVILVKKKPTFSSSVSIFQ